jgi:beta-glucosidase
MAQATFHFPKGFLWGTATAAYQVEGNSTNNDWWTWEQEPGRIIEGQKSGLADDWWGGRWREDFDRAAESGQNAHRLSVEWSRIQPTPDRWDENALDRYREMVRGLDERGLTPMVTLHHFTTPLWLVERGGWENEEIGEFFAKFARKVVEALHEYVNLWVTINEPNVLVTSAYFMGNFPPGKSDLPLAMRVMANLARAHALAYQAIHSEQATARVGIAQNYRGFTPTRPWFPPDRWVANLQAGLFNDFFPIAFQTGVLRYPGFRRRMAEAKGTQDFLGLNYYTRDYVKFNLLKPDELFSDRYYLPGADLSPTGMIANAPQGMFEAMKWAQQFNLPVLITENGVEDQDDRLRPRYLIQHLHQVWRGVNFNFPIKGYFHWTLVDNFEWERGWTQRFGLWELDVDTQARRKRASADLYSEICRENGISSDMVARYAPELFDSMFPN